MNFASKLIQAYPYDEVDISQYQKKFVPDEKAIRTAMNRLVNKHITWSEGAPAVNGDVVTCSMRSVIEKFNRSAIQITLGSGLFDRETEAALLGAKPEDKVSVQKDGETVEIQVLAVRNKYVPVLTDEMVQALEIPSIDTVDAYRRYLVDAQRKEQFNDDSYAPCKHIINTVLERSEIVLKEADWQRDVDWQLHKVRTYCEDEGVVLEEMKDDDWDGKVPVKSYFEFIALLQKCAWENVSLMVLGFEEAKKQGYAPSREDYEHFLDEMVAGWGGKREMYAEGTPFEFFEAFSYANVYYRLVDEYLKKNLYLED